MGISRFIFFQQRTASGFMPSLVGSEMCIRTRNETRIAGRPVSVAKVAVDLTRQIFERLDDKAAPKGEGTGKKPEAKE